MTQAGEDQKKRWWPRIWMGLQVAAALAAVVGLLWVVIPWGWDKVQARREARPQARLEAEYGRIAQLRANVQLNALSKTLGAEPQVCREPYVEKPTYLECTFVRPYGYVVHAIVDRHKRVLQFSVTVRKQGFTPTFNTFPHGSGGGALPVVLGKSRLAEALDLEAVSYATASCGSGGVSYFAATGGSNADSGITYVLGVSESGLQDKDTEKAICEASESLSGTWGSLDNYSSTLDFVQTQKAKVLHQTAIIDTFAVTAPFVSLDDIEPPGPSISDIVAVEPNATE
jgi:hypothetical protein